MKIAECTHIRIRDSNNYGMNVERMIKRLEEYYQIDFRSMPQWKQLVQRLHLATTDCKRKIQDANHRKAKIIEKICIESFRPSPFELTDALIRTSKKWQALDARLKIKKKSLISLAESVPCSSVSQIIYDEIKGEESPGHPNTEVIISEPAGAKEELATVVAETLESSHLPPYISSNQHKHISLLPTVYSSLSVAETSPEVINMKCERKADEWLVLPQSTSVMSFPSTITIENKSLDEQTISFSLVNCSQAYLNFRYKGITNKSPFKRAIILPGTPVKLFPGIAVNFKFVFKLESVEDDFTSHLYFKVGQKVLAEAPVEIFQVPIVSKFIIKSSKIRVTEVVTIPPAYIWHINAKSGFPTGHVTINVPANESYYLHVMKIKTNLTHATNDDIRSIDAISLTTETVALREQDQEVITQSKTLVSPSETLEDIESVLNANLISLIIDEVVQLALDVFVFDKTFLHLDPSSKPSIKVFQTKAEHIGFHQDLYELVFTDPVTGEVAFRKTVKVFGEVLPDPIQVQPGFLDMTESPIVQGRCEDHFTIANNHSAFPVTIKIKLTTKIKKMIRVIPMTTLIAPRTNVKFTVTFCSKDLHQSIKEDYVHLTFKMIVIGDPSVYRNHPPIFYELLAPCTSEFKKLYSKKVFNEFVDPSLEKIVTEPDLLLMRQTI